MRSKPQPADTGSVAGPASRPRDRAHVEQTPATSTGSDGPARRTVLGVGAVLGGTALGGAVLTRALTGSGDPAESTSAVTAAASSVTDAAVWGEQRVPFYGEHQAGILTRRQSHALFLGLDLRRARAAADRARVVSLLRMLTDDAGRLTSGRPPLGGLETAPIALPGRLTVTVGFGPGLFDAAGVSERCPPAVRAMPAFGTDAFEERWGQTDLLVQVCGDDPLVLAYARRRLLRDAAAFATLRWAQQGFTTARGREPGTSTPRNLMGMRDGSGDERDPAQRADVVWSRDPTRPWLHGGTQLVLRRVRIDLDRWDDLETSTKEATFGRRIGSGAPLTGVHENDTLQRDEVDAQGFRFVAPHAHAARAQARTGSQRMIRRGYNYDDGLLPDGSPDAGLLFAAFQADIETAFVPVQTRLAQADALNDWITHIGSAAYAVPPGVDEGSWLGEVVLT